MGYFTPVYTSGLPHRARSVYMYLRDRCDKDGKCYPAIGTIAAELKLLHIPIFQSRLSRNH